MKILILSWEYPPKNIGGISNHVFFISKALVKLNHEVHIVTCKDSVDKDYENCEGVHVHRVKPYNIHTEDFTKWVMHLNYAMIEEGVKIAASTGNFDIIHAHDWLSAYSGRALKWILRIPLVCTMHATEYGRNGGLRNEMQNYISNTEKMLIEESWKVVTCSRYMRKEVSDLFKTSWDKIWEIPNGVNTEQFEFEFNKEEFRRKFANNNEKIILFVGRHVYEKGIHILIDAAANIVKKYGGVKFIISGKGSMTEELKRRVRDYGLDEKIIFPGYVEDETRNKLFKISDVVVFPSIYEPFGIAALEAMAAGCPVIASDVGGLSELIQNRVNGLKFESGSKEDLISNLIEVLDDKSLANYLADGGMNTVSEKYSWRKAAELTVEMYSLIQKEAKNTEWIGAEEFKNISAKDELVKFKETEKKFNNHIDNLTKELVQKDNELEIMSDEYKKSREQCEKELKSLTRELKKKDKLLKNYEKELNKIDSKETKKVGEALTVEHSEEQKPKKKRKAPAKKSSKKSENEKETVVEE